MRRSKLCLKMGEAILGTPPLSPTMPRDDHEGLAEGIEVVDGVDLVAVADAHDGDLPAADQRARRRCRGRCRRARRRRSSRAPPRARTRDGATLSGLLAGQRQRRRCGSPSPSRSPGGAAPRSADEHDARDRARRCSRRRGSARSFSRILERRLPLALVGVDDVRHLRLELGADAERVVDDDLRAGSRCRPRGC